MQLTSATIRWRAVLSLMKWHPMSLTTHLLYISLLGTENTRLCESNIFEIVSTYCSLLAVSCITSFLQHFSPACRRLPPQIRIGRAAPSNPHFGVQWRRFVAGAVFVSAIWAKFHADDKCCQFLGCSRSRVQICVLKRNILTGSFIENS
jgi:hypothetical protein